MKELLNKRKSLGANTTVSKAALNTTAPKPPPTLVDVEPSAVVPEVATPQINASHPLRRHPRQYHQTSLLVVARGRTTGLASHTGA